MICLVQLLHYESQKYKKKKHILECDQCPFEDKCKPVKIMVEKIR